MKKLITTLFLVLTAFIALAQNYKYVNTSTLNVRENPGSNFKVIGMVEKGDRLLVISEENGWSEIKTTTGKEGYVATKYLTIETQKSKNPADKKENSSAGFWFLLIGIIVLFVLVLKWYFSGTCSNCRKNRVMKFMKKVCTGEKPTIITEKREEKNSKGEVTKTWEVDVPATRYFYETYRRCKNCGHVDMTTSNVVRKN